MLLCLKLRFKLQTIRQQLNLDITISNKQLVYREIHINMIPTILMWRIFLA